MDSKTPENIESAEIVLLCVDFGATFEFFTQYLKFKIFSVFPADNPSVAIVFGYGLRIRLEKTDTAAEEEAAASHKIQINLNCNSLEETTEIIAPNGVKIKFVEKDPPLILPEFESKFVLNKFSEDADWMKGRADMCYRDLIPNRQGGRFIASHIRIPKGGIVPDYVHFHKIYFQMIYCRKGWAKLVYEDQGEPFIFKAGDCVLQPPEIRHRVLESSDNLEVIEVSGPAEHETFAEHRIALPTKIFDPTRDFGGQKFVHHIADKASLENWRIEGFECRNTGIRDATNGLANVEIVRPSFSTKSVLFEHNADFVFVFILHGKAEFLRENNHKEAIHLGDSLVIPPKLKHTFAKCSEDFEMLEVML